MRHREVVPLCVAVLLGTASSYTPPASSLSRRNQCNHHVPRQTTVRPWRVRRIFGTRRPLSASPSIDGEADTGRVDVVSHVSIEYCTGCKWMLRAGWMAEELLTTFQDDLTFVTLIPSRPPSSPGAIFNVRIDGSNMLWNRTAEGRFPEAKELKQIVRDIVAPERDLGHIDGHKAADETKEEPLPPEGESTEEQEATNDPLLGLEDVAPRPNLAIAYCTGCNWLFRATSMAKELLTTFPVDLNSVTIVPSRPPEPGGRFICILNGKVLWDRREEGRHPEAKEVKQRVRDALCPTRDLGHSDVKRTDNEDENKDLPFEEMSDEDAAAMRNMFGVS